MLAGSTSPSARLSGPSQGSNCRHFSVPSLLMGWRTCSELAVRTLRSAAIALRYRSTPRIRAICRHTIDRQLCTQSAQECSHGSDEHYDAKTDDERFLNCASQCLLRGGISESRNRSFREFRRIPRVESGAPVILVRRCPSAASISMRSSSCSTAS